MRIRFLVIISLMLCIGLTVGRSVDKNKTNGTKEAQHKKELQKKSAKPERTAIDPLDELLQSFGLSAPKFVDTEFFDEQQKVMDAIGDEFMKDLFGSFEADSRKEQKTKPLVNNKPTNNTKALDSTIQSNHPNSTSKSGLPVFHPNRSLEELNDNIGSQIDSIFSSFFKPVLTIINEDINNKSAKEVVTLDVDWDSLNDNKTKSNDTNIAEDLSPFKDVWESVFDSFTKFGQLLENSLINELNKTNDTNDDNMLVTEKTMNGWVEVKLTDCKCPEAKYGKHKEECPLNVQHMSKTAHKPKTAPLSAKDEAEAKLLDEMQLLLMNSEEDQGIYRNLKPSLTDERSGNSPIIIEHQFQHKFTIDKDDDYEWYDWVLVALVSTTSLVLLIIAMFICFKRTQKSKAIQITESVAQKPNDFFKTNIANESSLQNENFNNSKKMEKIKTIFVNLK